VTGRKKTNEGVKPLEVVFIVEGGKVKMKSVKRGICDDSYVEIKEGVVEGEDVVSGGYKAINRELEDGKMVTEGAAKNEGPGEKK
jgi:HlyD family secretion protein